MVYSRVKADEVAGDGGVGYEGQKRVKVLRVM